MSSSRLKELLGDPKTRSFLLQKALEGLSNQKRLCVLYHVDQGLSQTETGIRVGLTQPTVSLHLLDVYNALKELAPPTTAATVMEEAKTLVARRALLQINGKTTIRWRSHPEEVAHLVRLFWKSGLGEKEFSAQVGMNLSVLQWFCAGRGTNSKPWPALAALLPVPKMAPKQEAPKALPEKTKKTPWDLLDLIRERIDPTTTKGPLDVEDLLVKVGASSNTPNRKAMEEILETFGWKLSGETWVFPIKKAPRSYQVQEGDEAQILSFLDRGGVYRTRDVANGCELTLAQAHHSLTRLLRIKKVGSMGQGRGLHYYKANIVQDT